MVPDTSDILLIDNIRAMMPARQGKEAPWPGLWLVIARPYSITWSPWPSEARWIPTSVAEARRTGATAGLSTTGWLKEGRVGRGKDSVEPDGPRTGFVTYGGGAWLHGMEYH